MKPTASALAFAVLVAGCGGTRVTGVVFTVDAPSGATISNVARLHGTVSLNGAAAVPFDLQHSPAISIPPSPTFSLQLPDNATGSVVVHLQALGSDDTVLASGDATSPIVPHGIAGNAHILLTPTGSGLVFDNSAHDFGTVTLSQPSAPFTFTATNNGTIQSGTPAVSIDGANAGDFSSTTTCNNPVTAGGMCTIAVTFTPAAAGARSATLHLSASPGGEATASLTGTGMMSAGATFSISPMTFQFNDTVKGATGNSTTFTVTNTGGAASPTLPQSTLTGGMKTSFSITSDGCFAQALAPASQCTVTVQFTPAAAGMQTSSLAVASASAALTGRGVGVFHAEGNTNGGPGPGNFWYGAFAPSSDEIFATNGNTMYLTAGGMPATFSTYAGGPASGGQLQKIWGPSKGSVYVVDNKGEVLHYSGSGLVFSLFNGGNLFGGGCCSGIWGFSDTNFYAVGNTAVEHYDGSWHAQTVNTTATVALNAIWGSAANNLYAVGKGGLIVFNNGASDTWASQTSNTTADLYSIYGSGANDIYAVGYTSANPPVPVIVHYNGVGWTTQTSGITNGEFNTIWVAPDGEAWIGDLYGPLLHSDGDGSWTNITPANSNTEKWQITGTSDHDVYVFAEDGEIFHYY